MTCIVSSGALNSTRSTPHSSIHYFSTAANLAPYHWTGLAATQHRLGVSLATGSGSWTVEADCGNGYAPGWGMLLMMMTSLQGSAAATSFRFGGSKFCGESIAVIEFGKWVNILRSYRHEYGVLFFFLTHRRPWLCDTDYCRVAYCSGNGAEQLTL